MTVTSRQCRARYYSIMKRRNGYTIGLFLAAMQAASVAYAADTTTTTVETFTEEWVEPDGDLVEGAADAPRARIKSIAHYGPFHVVAANRAELRGSIESETLRQFKAMLFAYPGIKQIDIVDCPGTGDDAANFAIARLIRQKGISTFVPDGGFAGSGGVELFLSGTKRRAAPTAEFAVHSWRDENGREANDYAANAPENLAYINFYKEIGMEDGKAKAFYAMTNSVPHSSALYLKPSDIARFAALD
jgi:ATP-dependent protease ClpP protease subunit